MKISVPPLKWNNLCYTKTNTRARIQFWSSSLYLNDTHPVNLHPLKVSKSQKQFLLKLHYPKNERSIRQNSALWSLSRILFKISFFWAMELKCFWDLLTFRANMLLMREKHFFFAKVDINFWHVAKSRNLAKNHI